MGGSELYLQLQKREKNHAESAKWVRLEPSEAAESGSNLTPLQSKAKSNVSREGAETRRGAAECPVRWPGPNLIPSILEDGVYQWILYSIGIQILRVLRALRVKFFLYLRASAAPREL
jgi:hypothetical protein